MSRIFCSSLREFKVPDLRLENAASVGAKRVKPFFVSLSCPLIWSATAVLFKRRIKIVKPPAFWRILVTSGGPGGVGASARLAGESAGLAGESAGLAGATAGKAGALAGWPKVVVLQQQKKASASDKERKACFLIFVSMVVCVPLGKFANSIVVVVLSCRSV